MKFHPGRVDITVAAWDELVYADVIHALMRHLNGDWGELSEGDRQTNEKALREDDRLFSSYRDRQGVKFWIITEWDRSYTTILLPSDY